VKQYFIIILLIGSPVKANDQQTFSINDMCELVGHYQATDENLMFGMTSLMLADAGIAIGSGRCNTLRLSAFQGTKRFYSSGDVSHIRSDLLLMETRFKSIVYRSIIKQSGIKIE